MSRYVYFLDLFAGRFDSWLGSIKLLVRTGWLFSSKSSLLLTGANSSSLANLRLEVELFGANSLFLWGENDAVPEKVVIFSGLYLNLYSVSSSSMKGDWISSSLAVFLVLGFSQLPSIFKGLYFFRYSVSSSSLKGDGWKSYFALFLDFISLWAEASILWGLKRPLYSDSPSILNGDE